MSVRITGRHLEVTDEIRRYVEKKLTRLQRLTENVQSIDIILDHHHGYEYKAELLLKDGPVSIAAKTKDSDLQRAIDTLIDKAERQLKKKWEKVRAATKKQKAKGGAVRKTALASEPDEEESTEGAGVAVATRKRARAATRDVLATLEKFGVHVFPPQEVEIATLSIPEAAEELFFHDENFLCFRDRDTEELRIMFRRKDGNFGLLKPVID